MAAIALGASCGPAGAEVTLADGTALSGQMIVDAAQGETRGANLLHSFGRLHVRTGESLTFTGPDVIANVIARVTGDEGSEIDGLLRSAITAADLFLINPNGVTFGDGAVLDVDGAFYVSTARSLHFTDGSLLTVSATGSSGFTAAPPEAFGFGATPAAIDLIRTTLGEGSVDGLHVSAGPILLDHADVRLPGADVSLAALTGEGEVPLVGMPSGNGAGITITGTVDEEARIETSGDPAGRLTVYAGDLTLQSAFLFADTTGSQGSAGIEITAHDTLVLRGGARITTDVLGEGAGGGLQVTAGTVNLADPFTKISSDNRSGTAASGDIEINATSVDLEQGAQISTVTLAEGAAGNITLNSDAIRVSSGAAITAETNGPADAGAITLRATDLVDVSGPDSAVSSSTLFDSGNAGSITIETARLVLGDEGRVAAESVFPFAGAPGTILIDASEVDVSGNALVTSNNASLSADSGTVTVNANSILLRGADADRPDRVFSGIVSGTAGDGAGGSIRLNVGSLAVRDGARIEAVTESFGAAGSISVVGNVAMDAGFIDARTLGEGAGGDISVSGRVTLDNGARIDTSTPLNFAGVGSAGRIRISGEALEVGAGSSVASATDGAGNAGSISIDSADVTVRDAGTVETNTRGMDSDAGSAGSVSISADQLLVTAGGLVSSTTAGPAPGGSLNISALRTDLLDAGGFGVSAAGMGDAGNIRLAADVLQMTAGVVETSAALSGGGNVTLDIRQTLFATGSTITASSGGPEAGADGGNLTFGSPGMAAPGLLLLDQSQVVAQAVAGNGGIINLYSGDFLADVHSLISATSELGNDGEVTIAAPDSGVAGVVAALNVRLAEARALLAEPCAAAALERRSSLIVEQGVPRQAPDDVGMQPAMSCEAPRR